jgi:hypothetical protein
MLQILDCDYSLLGARHSCALYRPRVDPAPIKLQLLVVIDSLLRYF